MPGGAGPSAPTASAQVKSATRTLDIIEHVIAQGRPLVAQDIATALAIPVSSLSYLLSTLVDRQYLERDGRYYRPGPGLERLQARDGAFTLAERVAPLVRTLRVQLNETASFFVRTGWEVEAIATETSEQALRYAVSTGTRAPLHALAAGKAILATMPDDELATYFRQVERGKFTEYTIVDEDVLRTQIAQVRRTGFAQTDEEYTLGIAGIARVVTSGGAIAGALSVAMPKARFDPAAERRIATLLQKTASLLEAA